ncbi:MAG: tetratricopeptide repeat protein [Thermoanaerobaculia bacterium]|nr:tetratricopeptide repeat protein [Thermoanaerobaculia bacterium]
MRRGSWVPAVVLVMLFAGCRSNIDLSTDTGQMRFGVQAAKMDLWREAQFRFHRAVEMDPNDPFAYNNLAVAYEGIGEYEKAREAYLRALRIDRSNQYIQRNYTRFVEFYSERHPEVLEDAEEDDEVPPAEEESP